MRVLLNIAVAIDSLEDTVDQLTGRKPMRLKRTRFVLDSVHLDEVYQIA